MSSDKYDPSNPSKSSDQSKSSDSSKPSNPSNKYNLRMGSDDPEYIDAESSWEINYWSSQLKCTKQELMVAAKEVGPKMDKVKEFIAMINAVKKK